MTHEPSKPCSPVVEDKTRSVNISKLLQKARQVENNMFGSHKSMRHSPD